MTITYKPFTASGSCFSRRLASVQAANMYICACCEVGLSGTSKGLRYPTFQLDALPSSKCMAEGWRISIQNLNLCWLHRTPPHSIVTTPLANTHSHIHTHTHTHMHVHDGGIKQLEVLHSSVAACYTAHVLTTHVHNLK